MTTPLPALPARGAECPPAVDLEQYAAGALSSLEGHVAGCSACSTYVAEVKAVSEAFVRARPAERFLSQLEARERHPVRSRRGWVVAVAGVAGVAALALVGLVVLRAPVERGVTFKGALVTITFKRGDAMGTLERGATVSPGDALRFSVKADRPGYALVLERDGQGKVAVVAPFNASAPQRVGAGTTVLDDSAVLDASPGPETFVTVFAEKAFEVAPLVQQLEANRPVTCGGCTVETSSFDKR